MTYKQIIADYRKIKAPGNDTWLRHCAKTKDVLLVIEMAALARDLGNNKHPHQHRLPNQLLRKFADRLLKNAENILICKDFDRLYSTIRSSSLKGIGPLACYDTAQRIGLRLKLRPKKIYLHRGTRKGAELYLKRKIKSEAIDKSEFKDFEKLSCEEIEDVMCIYKDHFSDIIHNKDHHNGC